MDEQNPSAYRILIIDDEPSIAEHLASALQEDNFNTTVLCDPAIEEPWKNNHYDLIITDVMMPSINGYDLFQRIRNSQPDLPIIFFTALSSDLDELKALEMGASDFIPKPSHPQVIRNRILNILGQKPKESLETAVTYAFDGWKLLTKTRQLFSPTGSEAALSQKCFDLLHLFISKPKTFISRNDIVDYLYPYNYESNYRNIDSFIYKLRLALNDKQATIIKTIHGKGYIFPGDVQTETRC